MTESVIKLPSQIMDEREAELKAQMEEQIAEKDRQLEDKDAKIRYLEEMLSRFISDK